MPADIYLKYRLETMVIHTIEHDFKKTTTLEWGQSLVYQVYVLSDT